jgi:hypothetical protein
VGKLLNPGRSGDPYPDEEDPYPGEVGPTIFFHEEGRLLTLLSWRFLKEVIISLMEWDREVIGDRGGESA